jgi:uncharacterized protein (TIGR03000 family)
MMRNGIRAIGAMCLAMAAALLLPAASFAGPHGGGGGGHGGGGAGHGGGGGGHGGGGHGGHASGGGSHPGPGGSFHGGHDGFRHHDSFFFGVGGFYPGFYGVYGPSYYAYDDVPVYRGSNVIYTTTGPAPQANSAPAADRAYVTIQLPVDKADVWIEGVKSTQDVSSQEYVSPPLEVGKKYYYDVRARWTDAKGKTVEAKRSFPIYPGKPVLIDFTEPAAPPSDK